MKIKLGDTIIAPEYGEGKIVALSEEWIIVDIPDLGECPLSVNEDEFYLPAEIGDIQSTIEEIEI